MQLTHLVATAVACAAAAPQVAAWSFHHSHGHSHTHNHGSQETCEIVPVESAGEYYCGGIGSIDHQAYVYRRYTGSSLDQCKTNCMETDKCESFAYHHSTGCILYTKSLRKQGFRAHNGGSTMYNRGCFSRVCTSTSSSSSSSSHSSADAPSHDPPSQQQQQQVIQPQDSPSSESAHSPQCEYSFCNSRLAQCRSFNVTSSNLVYRAYPYAIAKSAVQSLSSPAHTAPTIIRSYDPAFFSVCDAISSCGNAAATEKYFSFDLHFRFSLNRYECVLFKGRPATKDCTWFNVTDSDVSCAAGWGLETIGQ